jgi:hypothetical protein
MYYEDRLGGSQGFSRVSKGNAGRDYYRGK